MIPKSKTTSLLLLLFFFTSASLQNGIIEDQPQPPLYWVKKIKALFIHAQSYLFPPNLDFRGTIGDDESAVKGIEGGAGDKIKEAVAKSLGEGKATVEESAKSAANLAKEKMHQTAQKLKETLSSEQHEPKTQEL